MVLEREGETGKGTVLAAYWEMGWSRSRMGHNGTLLLSEEELQLQLIRMQMNCRTEGLVQGQQTTEFASTTRYTAMTRHIYTAFGCMYIYVTNLQY